MSAPIVNDPPTAPDVGRTNALIVATVLATISAIGAAALTAIGLAITFELRPMIRGPYEQFRLIGDASRFSAEGSALLVFFAAYRMARGRRIIPKRTSILGVMLGTAAIGLATSRFVVNLGPWLVR